MKYFLKNKAMWTPVWMVALLTFLMTLIYVPIFPDTPKLRGFPIVIVNEDKGISGQSMVLGDAIVANMLQSTTDKSAIKWEKSFSRENGLNVLLNNQAYAALIIPADYTQSVVQLSQALLSDRGNAKPAVIEVWLNQGGGQYSSGIAQTTTQTAVSQISQSIAKQIQQGVTSEGIKLSPENAIVFGNPVTLEQHSAPALPKNSANAMTPFILSLICIISGMMGSQMVDGYTNPMGKALKDKGIPLSDLSVLNVQMLLGLCMTVLVSLLLMIGVFGIYGLGRTVNLASIYGFCVFSALTMFMFFKMFGMLLGRWNMLVSFPLNIIGIFASGGPIALAALPAFHRFFSAILPSRYIMDGMRSLIYYSGRTAAGLLPGLTILSVILVLCMYICYMIPLFQQNRRRKQLS